MTDPARPTSRAAALRAWLARPVDSAPLAAFRILFGLVMFYEVAFFFWPMADTIFSPRYFHFGYQGFEWVKPWPGIGMHLHFAVLLLSVFGLLFGWRYRISAVIFTLLFTQVFLIEQLIYNNHFYLYVLLGPLFIVTAAHASFSLDRRRNPGMARTIPFWSLLLFRAQIIIVYFFGGIAKLDADWLAGEPLRKWMALSSDMPVFGPLMTAEWLVYALAWSGLVFDLAIGFLLCWRKTFVPAAIATIFFHTVNFFLFDIGAFPIVGIATLVLFVEPGKMRRWMDGTVSVFRRTSKPGVLIPDKITHFAPCSLAITAALAVWLAVQIFLPLRIHFYAGNPSWNESAHSFSWRMMLRTKDASFALVLDQDALATLGDRPDLELKPDQASIVAKNPNLIHQYVQHVGSELESAGVVDPQIRVRAVASLNGRPFQLLVDPAANLAAAPNPPLATPDWVIPLEPDQPIGTYLKSDEDRLRAMKEALERGKR